jgi:predicted chitinase
MPVRFNIDEVIDLYKEKGGDTDFPDSLRDVLRYVQNDKHITSINQVAYLLATAKIESDYSLQRWEADYLCGKAGVPYKNKPCEKAINYYRSSAGNKQNYFTLGTDSRGMCFFGRGLIQLTGKANYEKYGKLIGVNLVADGDRAMIPKNSYDIASEYLNERTWKYVDKGDLYWARKSVNGSTNKINEVNSAYKFWMSILNNPKTKFKATEMSLRKRRIIGVSIIAISLAVIGISAYFVLKNKNK